MDTEGKQLLNQMLDLFENIDNATNGEIRPDKDAPLQGTLVSELCLFLMYLAASDGQVSDEDARFFQEYFLMDITTDFIKNTIREGNLYSLEFEQLTPKSLTFALAFDHFQHPDSEEKGVSGLVILLFAILGKEFINYSHDETEDEVNDLKIYLDNLRKFQKEANSSIGTTEIPVENGNPVSNEEVSLTTNTASEKEIDVIDIEVDQFDNETDDLDSLLKELYSLIGLDSVKSEVKSLVNLLQVRRMREMRGMKQIPMSLHLVFSGNPGTGKTTVARLLARIYHQLGILSKGHLIEVDRSGLVGGYVGQTALKVKEVLQKSLGGILFIDEAYTLTANKSENDYGYEAVDTLLKGMEDHRDDLVVIVAGYPDLMDQFLSSNPGLRSRFNKFIIFEDYSSEELTEIFVNICEKSGYSLAQDVKEYVKSYYESKLCVPSPNFANGRDVRNFFETAITNQANRLSDYTAISNLDLERIILEDVTSIL